MAVRNYFIKAEGWDGRTYEVLLIDTRETSGSSTLVAQRNFLEMGGGEKDDDRTRPLWPREARLTFLNNEPVTPLSTGLGKDIRAVVREDSTNSTIMKGYAVSSYYQDAPLGPQPTTIQLPIIDGLPLLRDIGFDEIDGTPHLWPEISVSRLIYLLLNELYPSNQSIEVALNRYPETSTLTSSDCPLQHVTLDPSNYRDTRPDGEDWWNCYDVLKDVLQCFGLICRQTERRDDAVWHIRPHEEAASSIHLWEIEQGDTTVLNTSADISRSIASDTVDLRLSLDHARDFTEPRRGVEFTHDLGNNINYIANGSFEELGPSGQPLDWTLGTTWTNDVVAHSADSNTPPGTSENEFFGKITADSDQSSVQWGFQQQLPLIPPPSDLQISLEMYQDSAVGFLTKMKCGIGNFVVNENTTTINGDHQSGEIILDVDPVEVPIPKGFELPILDSGSFESNAEVLERVPAGQNSIPVQLEKDVSDGSDAYYLQMYHTSNTSTESFAPANWRYPDVTEWGRVTVQVAMVTANDVQVTGREIDVCLGATNQTGFTQVWGFDKLKVQPLFGGRPAARSISTADTGGSGKTDELDARLGSGPGGRGLEKLRAFPAFNNVYTSSDITDIDASTDTITLSGDQRSLIRVGALSYLARADVNTGFYSISAVAYDNNNNVTNVSVDPDVHPIRTPDAIGANTEFRAYPQRDFNPVFWGIGPDPSTTYPLHELVARQRLRYFRDNVERLEFTLYVEDDIDPVRPHHFVDIDGTDYTVSSLEFTPNDRGDQQVTLLRHNDFGT